MALLLSWRLWAAVALAGILAFSHFTAYRKGKHVVEVEWQASVAASNAESRRLEQRRQDRANEAAQIAASRDAAIRAESLRARNAAGELRDALNFANRAREESQAAAAKRASALGELLAASAEAHRELAQRCDRHVNDLRMLLEAWPK